MAYPARWENHSFSRTVFEKEFENIVNDKFSIPLYYLDLLNRKSFVRLQKASEPRYSKKSSQKPKPENQKPKEEEKPKKEEKKEIIILNDMGMLENKIDRDVKTLSKK
mgnify:CR=1 FL=1